MKKLLLTSVVVFQMMCCLAQTTLSTEVSGGLVFKRLKYDLSSPRYDDFNYEKNQGHNLTVNFTIEHKDYFEHGVSLMYSNEKHDKEYQNINYALDRRSSYSIEWWLPDTLLTMTNWKKYAIFYGVGVKKKWGNFAVGTRLYLGGTYVVAPKRTEIFQEEPVVQTAKGFYFSGRWDVITAYYVRPFLSLRLSASFMTTAAKDLTYPYIYNNIKIDWQRFYLLNLGVGYHFVK